MHREDTDYLWASWEKPTRYIYTCGHAGIVLKRKKIATDTINFIQESIELPTLSQCHALKQEITKYRILYL